MSLLSKGINDNYGRRYNFYTETWKRQKIFQQSKTLLNRDYKIFTTVLAARLKGGISKNY